MDEGKSSISPGELDLRSASDRLSAVVDALPADLASSRNLWVANWQLWHKSPLWCSLAQIGRVSRRDCTSGFSQNSA